MVILWKSKEVLRLLTVNLTTLQWDEYFVRIKKKRLQSFEYYLKVIHLTDTFS